MTILYPSSPTSITATDSTSSRETADVACDACVLINFVNIDRLDILKSLPQYRFIVLDAVDAEVTKKRHRMALAYQHQFIHRADHPGHTELVLFARLTQSMGRGEAACLAAAQCRGTMLASDEKRAFRRMAIAYIGESRIIGTADIICIAIQNQSITVSEANEAKAMMEEYGFRMPFASFSESISP